MSVVLGVHDGHNASVALLRDGRIELALQEERLTRVKNQGDAPSGSLRTALELIDRDSAPIGAPIAAPVVALNGHYMNYGQWQRGTILRDYARCSGLGSRVKQTFKNSAVDRTYQRRRAAERAEHLSELGLSSEQLAPVEHHQAHAAAAYYTAPLSKTSDKVLVFTCDGSGDRLSATVNVGEAGQLRRIAQVSEHDSIGRVYALVTRWLGMCPMEHEYKVMGLAPYGANSRGSAEVANSLEALFEFTTDGLGWRRRKGVPSLYAAYEFLGRMVAGQRFDWVAGGAQRFIEKMLTRWVAGVVRETGIGRIACSGGVFMNVKANLAILELPEVESMYVFPSCGDESNSIGAACFEAARRGETIEPLGAIYYGNPITDAEAEQSLKEAARTRLRFHWIPDIEKKVACELAQGRIVARAKGAAEFGARALGNRSILARADSTAAVRTINQAIKNRDFWMPFAPAVLAERASRYYEKPKPVESPYMMFAFRTRPEGRAALEGAQHPQDFTTRPQEVRAGHNPEFHRLLEEYESITGEAAVLNTSFNLHGEPIVYRARDAVDVFLRSGLEHMALANWWVEKAA